MVELWAGSKLLGAIPGGMVTDIIKDYLNRLAILHHFQAKLEESRATPQPPDGPSPEIRRERRIARRKSLKKASRRALIFVLSATLGFGGGAGLGAYHFVHHHPDRGGVYPGELP